LNQQIRHQDLSEDFATLIHISFASVATEVAISSEFKICRLHHSHQITPKIKEASNG